MFYILQKNFQFQILVLAILLGIFGFQLFTGSVGYTGYDEFLPYSASFSAFATAHQGGAKAIFLGIFLIQQLFLFLSFKRNRFADRSSLLPCIALTAFYVGGNIATHCTPAILVNLATTIILLLGDDTSQRHIRSKVLVAGMLIGIVSLYDLNAIVLLVPYALILLTNRLNKAKDIVIAVIGVLVPYLYVMAFHFFRGDLLPYLHTFTSIHLSFPLFTATHLTIVQLVATLVMALLIIYIVIRLKIRYDHKVILIRKRFLSIIFLFIATTAMLLLSNTAFPFSFRYLFIPLAFFTASYMQSNRFSILKELVMVLLFVSITLVGMAG